MKQLRKHGSCSYEQLRNDLSSSYLPCLKLPASVEWVFMHYASRAMKTVNESWRNMLVFWDIWGRLIIAVVFSKWTVFPNLSACSAFPPDEWYTFIVWETNQLSIPVRFPLSNKDDLFFFWHSCRYIYNLYTCILCWALQRDEAVYFCPFMLGSH